MIDRDMFVTNPAEYVFVSKEGLNYLIRIEVWNRLREDVDVSQRRLYQSADLIFTDEGQVHKVHKSHWQRIG